MTLFRSLNKEYNLAFSYEFERKGNQFALGFRHLGGRLFLSFHFPSKHENDEFFQQIFSVFLQILLRQFFFLYFSFEDFHFENVAKVCLVCIMLCESIITAVSCAFYCNLIVSCTVSLGVVIK
jgi:hypothetical protein